MLLGGDGRELQPAWSSIEMTLEKMGAGSSSKVEGAAGRVAWLEEGSEEWWLVVLVSASKGVRAEMRRGLI